MEKKIKEESGSLDRFALKGRVPSLFLDFAVS